MDKTERLGVRDISWERGAARAGGDGIAVTLARAADSWRGNEAVTSKPTRNVQALPLVGLNASWVGGSEVDGATLQTVFVLA